MIKILKFWKKYCLYCQKELFKDEKRHHNICFSRNVNEDVRDEEKDNKQYLRKETMFYIELNKHFDAKNFFR
jgi:hypothetical protein